MEARRLIKAIKVDGTGLFLHSHEAGPQVWADAFFGPYKSQLHVIDEQTMEIVKTLSPAPGKTMAHTEFTRDGSYSLASVREGGGALIFDHAKTLTEVRRLPMRKPAGKYNVWNKITFFDGTSH